MLGTIVDINAAEAYVLMPDGTIKNITLGSLPSKVCLGDAIDLNSLYSIPSRDVYEDRFKNSIL